MLQLNPTIPVIATSKDNMKGDALFVIDYGEQHSLIWIVALKNGEIWCIPNEEIRMQKNWTMGRR